MVLAAMGVSFAACSTGRAHQNFKSAMEAQVGRDLNDPHLLRNRSPNYVSTRALPNGNIEDEFKIGRRLNCRIFIEADKTVGKTVGWRYEGSEQDCVIVP